MATRTMNETDVKKAVIDLMHDGFKYADDGGW